MLDLVIAIKRSASLNYWVSREVARGSWKVGRRPESRWHNIKHQVAEKRSPKIKANWVFISMILTDERIDKYLGYIKGPD